MLRIHEYGCEHRCAAGFPILSDLRWQISKWLPSRREHYRNTARAIAACVDRVCPDGPVHNGCNCSQRTEFKCEEFVQQLISTNLDNQTSICMATMQSVPCATLTPTLCH